jgi:hypothetical protein
MVISGAQCVEVLERGGFVRVGESPARVWLARAHQLVDVPRERLLAPETLRTILKSAGMTEWDFTARLLAPLRLGRVRATAAR